MEAPSAGELDVLGVFWEEQEREQRPLQLSEVFRKVCERRRRFGEFEPALSTVSTHLRKLTAKGLLAELGATRNASDGVLRGRGGFTPPTRSPLTMYRVLYPPGDVLRTTFRGLAAAYPAGRRREALIDFARALELPAEDLGRLTELLATLRRPEESPPPENR